MVDDDNKIPADPDASTADLGKPSSAALPRKIGHYSIKRIIASGGMGTVYLAQQEQPRRVVALKVMKKGIASKSALRRFEFESQILARLKHPNVAQVYEAGTHDDGEGGVPYFAMEYIPNAKPITQYARDNSLSTKERLELFAKVCAAVHHGHLKGIIHRDLKPGNILVDSGGEPKVIDFGVARATDSDMAITTLQTDIGQLIGTLQYMSPEQCEGDPHDLDTRSDVYALGVVLYELLTESLPYDLSHIALHEAARVIREETPTKPSTINKTLRGDVETITLKALEKDRDLRYESAGEFGKDVRCFLNNDPIAARPPSMAYQIRMFARKNRIAFLALTSIVVTLAVATIVSITFLLMALRAKTQLHQTVSSLDNALNRAERNRDALDNQISIFKGDFCFDEVRIIFSPTAPQDANAIETEILNIPVLLERSHFRDANRKIIHKAYTLAFRDEGSPSHRTIQPDGSLSQPTVEHVTIGDFPALCQDGYKLRWNVMLELFFPIAEVLQQHDYLGIYVKQLSLEPSLDLKSDERYDEIRTFEIGIFLSIVTEVSWAWIATDENTFYDEIEFYGVFGPEIPDFIWPTNQTAPTSQEKVEVENWIKNRFPFQPGDFLKRSVLDAFIDSFNQEYDYTISAAISISKEHKDRTDVEIQILYNTEPRRN